MQKARGEFTFGSTCCPGLTKTTVLTQYPPGCIQIKSVLFHFQSSLLSTAWEKSREQLKLLDLYFHMGEQEEAPDSGFKLTTSSGCCNPLGSELEDGRSSFLSLLSLKLYLSNNNKILK